MSKIPLFKLVTYFGLIFFMFHFSLYSLETFKIVKLPMILMNALISTIISVVFTFIIWGFIPNNQI